ncbi:PIR Superfamily Protein, partial [Plasmodium malariae]
MEEKDYEEILKKLPSNEIYKEFKSEINKEDNKINCDIFNSVKREYKDNCVKLCKNVVKNFKSLYEKSKLENYNDICEHYKYWIYEQIGKLFESKHPNEDVNTVITAFLNLQFSLTTTYGIYNCKYHFVDKNLNELNEKKEEKYLHDYFANYKSIK